MSQRSSLDLPHRPPFPTDILPCGMRQIVEEISRAMQTPSALAAQLAIAALAACLARKVVVIVRPGWIEPTNVWTIVALSSGSRKSGVFREITLPIDQVEKEWAVAMQKQIATARNERKIDEKLLIRLQEEAAKADGLERQALSDQAAALEEKLGTTQVPVAPRLIVDDVTPERISSLLATHGGRLAVLSAEGTPLDALTRYTSGPPNLDPYLKAHAGDQIRVDRVGRPPEFVDQPALTLGLATQPAVIEGLAAKPGFGGRGFLARFFYGLPENTVGLRQLNEPPIPLTTQKEWGDLLRSLITMPLSVTSDGPQPWELSFTADAHTAFLEFERALEPRLSEFGDLGHIAEWGSKLAGGIARIAGLLHAAENVGIPRWWDSPIEEDTIRKTVRLAEEFLIPHALAAFAAMGADPVMTSARHLLRLLEHKGVKTISKRDLHQGARGRFKHPADMNPALKVLLDHGILSELPDLTSGRPGRRPSPTYEVHLAD